MSAYRDPEEVARQLREIRARVRAGKATQDDARALMEEISDTGRQIEILERYARWGRTLDEIRTWAESAAAADCGIYSDTHRSSDAATQVAGEEVLELLAGAGEVPRWP